MSFLDKALIGPSSLLVLTGADVFLPKEMEVVLLGVLHDLGEICILVVDFLQDDADILVRQNQHHTQTQTQTHQMRKKKEAQNGSDVCAPTFWASGNLCWVFLQRLVRRSATRMMSCWVTARPACIEGKGEYDTLVGGFTNRFS